ncbi:DNA mismatch repair protein MutS2 [Thermanaeromonas toyohensis ToBE]|uniref:Endonuclease MutS2 n=1 Tax=Thermanaeromonas toyohensis ToBE TaxID=698762 RepID=A0A1W1VZX3_9FIRM|nr:DNA mismatch repair protein MutS2 [Thermanaeromonas toyohensis ToBE]
MEASDLIFKTIEKLELGKILAQLKDCCSSPLGQDLVERLEPTTDEEEIKVRQAETEEACRLWRLFPDFNRAGIKDIRALVERAGVGGVLTGEELLQVASTLAAGRRLKKTLLQVEGAFPILKSWASRVGEFPRLEERIARTVREDGEIKDEATPKLLALRQRIYALQEKIKEKLEGYLRSSEIQKYLQDNLYTIRAGRYCLPVKQEYRNQIPGLVHDQSASGATLFIEPLALVELNNELKRLAAEEEREIEAILYSLSNLVGGEKEELTRTLQALARIDFILAKGLLSQRMDAVAPSLNTTGRWKIVAGRHPLLKGKVVPITLWLGEDFDILIITGPNTGGKTVTLKTLGLFTLMAQCGLHLPAQEAEISVAGPVFADIGDEQSIEQSLSTFSSHMSHIISILSQVRPGTLVLLDELGAGTDPTEGAALGMAILDYLASQGAKVVATTHYSELKAYAYVTSRVENAAVEFDSQTLKPTFRLLIGTPGESNAFIISQRLGLPEEVLKRARAYLSEEQVQISQMIQALAKDRQASREALLEAEVLREQAKEIRERAEKEWEETLKKAGELLEQARREAYDLIRRVKLEVREIRKQVERALAEEGYKDKIKTLDKVRTQLGLLSKEITDKALEYQPEVNGVPPVMVSPGERVWVVALNQEGQVLTFPTSQGEVLVQVGSLKVNVKLDELRLLPEKREKSKEQGRWVVQVTTRSLRPEIDLRGLSIEEACHQADKYLDDAYLAGLKIVSLIHGKGTGALRAALHRYLSTHPLVKSFRFGNAGEGGSGVTVVELK